VIIRAKLNLIVNQDPILPGLPRYFIFLIILAFAIESLFDALILAVGRNYATILDPAPGVKQYVIPSADRIKWNSVNGTAYPSITFGG
jgi:hypothetical protein